MGSRASSSGTKGSGFERLSGAWRQGPPAVVGRRASDGDQGLSISPELLSPLGLNLNMSAMVYQHLVMVALKLYSAAKTCQSGGFEPGHTGTAASVAIAAWLMLQALQNMEHHGLCNAAGYPYLQEEFPPKLRALIGYVFAGAGPDGSGQELQPFDMGVCSLCGLVAWCDTPPVLSRQEC